jgi:hypothetical protein
MPIILIVLLQDGCAGPKHVREWNKYAWCVRSVTVDNDNLGGNHAALLHSVAQPKGDNFLLEART